MNLPVKVWQPGIGIPRTQRLKLLSAVGQSAITVGGQMGYAGIKAPVRKLGQAIQTDVNMTEAAPQEAPQEAPEAQQAVPTDIDMTQAAQPAVPTEYDNETGQMGDIIPGGVDYDDFWQQAYSAADEIHEAAVAQPEVSAIDTQAHEAATSPENDLSEPTEAQKEAGNYKKGHIKLHGMDITIENPAGSVRKGVDESGNAWETPINHHYGYIKGTVGFDKDHLDVVLGPEAESADTAYVIDQQNAEGGFDEHKVVIGATDEDHALEIYNSNYEPGWDGAAAVTPMPMDEFKAWAKSDAPKQGAASDAGKAVNIGDTIEYDGMTFSVDVNEETGNPVLIDPETGTMEEFESHEQFTAETGLSLADHIPGAKNMVETSGQVVDANNMVDNDQDAAISDSDSPASAEGSLSDFLKSQSAVEAEQGRVGSTIVDETGTVTGRVPSLNPTWVQEAAAMVGGVQKLRNAVEKFEAGGKLGRNQAEAVRLVREQYEQQAEDFEYRSNMESLEQGMPEEKEEAYPEYWDEETRSIAELSDEAMNLLGVDAVIDILESSRDDGAIAADLYQLIKDANDGRESERSSEVSEGARSQAPAEPAEAATEGTAEEVEPTYASSNVTAKQGEDLKLFNTPSTFGEGITPDNAEHVNSLDFSLEEEEAGLFDDQPLETDPVVDQETGNVSDNEAESKPDQEKDQAHYPTANKNGNPSWIIRSKETGEAVMETTQKSVVDKINTDKYEAVPSLQHLQELNERAKADPASSDGLTRSSDDSSSSSDDFAISVARKQIGKRLISTTKDLGAINQQMFDAGLDHTAAYIGPPSSAKHVADIVADENLKAANTEAIRKAIRREELKLSKAEEKRHARISAGRTRGAGAGRV